MSNLSLINAKRITFLIVVLLTAACSTTYVNDPDKSRMASPGGALGDVVYFQVNHELDAFAPQCIHVMPFDDPLGLDAKGNFRKAFHAQLSITGVRLVPLQAVLGQTSEQVSEQYQCEYELRGTVTDNSRLFLGVYSEYKAGAKAELIHLPTGKPYWQGSHRLVKRSGGVPIGLISSISGAANASKNLGPEQALRVSYELASKLVNSIPKLEYAIKSPPEPSLEIIQGAPVTLSKALESDDHGAVISAIDEMAAKGDLTSDLWFLRGRAYQSMGRHESATADFISAIAFGDETDKPYLSLGRSYAALGRFDFAAAAFDKAYQLNEDNIDALMLGAVARSASGDEDEAYELLREALVKSLATADTDSARRVVNALHSTGLFGKLSSQDQTFLETQL